ncbi:hypothetical protein PPROV_000263700 [Pycnococcus provasolii]|uniref:Uncharacterized protein n=1 Tax=Pycnococcus provasolii TaxID=41880 RepID=A0A6T5WWR7_9CHLO|nr:hypothetical protein PPROV_000263700 [Pycnococcus provasolii]|mmetsp:Transcript_3347/g.7560  ORF Transcript_3347/g.7560 Transcript_3347/m.7560 type:complete len:169 (+) Transcript_3347:109-615(+)
MSVSSMSCSPLVRLSGGMGRSRYVGRSGRSQCLGRRIRQRRLVFVSASDDKKGSSGSSSGGDSEGSSGPGGVDWDQEWKSFKDYARKSMDEYVDVYDEPPAQGYNSSNNEYGKEARDQIKRDERRALDAVVNENFTKTGFGVIALTLFVYVFIIGPPPSDGRCTLPWC